MDGKDGAMPAAKDVDGKVGIALLEFLPQSDCIHIISQDYKDTIG